MTQVDEYLEFTNAAGATFRFGSPACGLVSVEGLGDVDADIQTQTAPYQDGSTFIDAVLAPRFVNMEFIVRGGDYAEVSARRREMARTVNSKLGLGVLKYVSGDMVRIIDAVAESVPFFPDGDARGVRWQRGTITFIAPSPYWKSTEITEEPAFEALFEFPFEGEFEMGVQRNDRLIYNDGDSPAPTMVDFYGPSDSPIIENLTTGEFIRINKRLEEGEIFRINTANSSVYYINAEGTETNVFNWIDLESTFFKLAIGENDITCHCAISNNQKDFDIYYNQLYNAV